MKKLCMLLCILAVLVNLWVPATAQEAPELSLRYSYGVCEFEFYKLADLDLRGGLTAAAPFNSYTNVSSLLDDMENLDSEALRVLSVTLQALVIRDGIAPTYTASTDENGQLVLTDMQMGAYLILGEQTRDEQYVYTPYPFIVTVPTLTQEGLWDYSVTVDVTKVEKEEQTQELTQLKVLKLWKDAGTGSKRPVTIDVGLYRDGELYEKVTLSKKIDWTYEWTELPAGHTWTVVEEKVPEGYTMTVEKGTKMFVITNTGTTPPPPPPDIPQTGQLWWPVPVLALAGLVLLAVGVILRKLSYSE